MTEIVKTQTLQEKISDKIRASIGDLMTDEDLKPLVTKAIESLLMEERVVGGTQHSKNVKPPLLQEIMEPMIRKQVIKLVDEWFTNNAEVMSEVIGGVIKEGIFKTMISTMDSKLSGPLWEFQNKINEVFLRNNIS